ncbi:MAG: hypothetical protein R3D55_25610 [Chloroflexota bacterium]
MLGENAVEARDVLPIWIAEELGLRLVRGADGFFQVAAVAHRATHDQPPLMRYRWCGVVAKTAESRNSAVSERHLLGLGRVDV